MDERRNYYAKVIGYQKPISTILVGGEKAQWHIDVDQKFNWFQKRMLKWCFGFEVKENTYEPRRTKTTAD